MVDDRSLVVEEVVALDTVEVVRPEEAVMSSSSGDGSDSRSDEGIETQGEVSKAADLCESSRSYVFGPSTVMVVRIRQLASLGYFVEGATREPGEEVVPELADDEVVVFE
jgi:hypothetical protein